MESKENTEERPRNNTPYNCHTCQDFSCAVTDNTPRMMQPALMDREGSVRANVCYRNKDNHDKTDEEGIVSPPNTRTQPRTVVIKHSDAVVAIPTVLRAWRSDNLACRAKINPVFDGEWQRPTQVLIDSQRLMAAMKLIHFVSQTPRRSRHAL